MINGELIVDNFAGGGGTSTGIEIATGHSVDIAINHDPEAIRMHKVNHPGGNCKNPIHTITTGNQQCVISAALIQYHSETAGNVRGQAVDAPIMTVDSSNRYGLAVTFLSKYFNGFYKGAGDKLDNPLPTITAQDHNSIVTANLIQLNNHCDGRDITKPIPTITAGDGHFAEVRAFLVKYYGSGTGQNIEEP